MRIGDLIEQEQRPVSLLVQHLAKPDVRQRVDIGNHALMRCITGDDPPKIGNIADNDGDIIGNFQRCQRFARDRDFLYHPVRIVERGFYRVPAPEFESAAGFLD